MSKIVVVGNGMAGGRLVEQLVTRGAEDLTVFGDEPQPAYNRVLLSGVLAGTHSRAEVALRAPGWYSEHGVDLRTEVRIRHIDLHRQQVVTELGEETGYDHLVMATGSQPQLPPIRGLVDQDGRMNPGVFAFRTLDDCRRILAAARPSTRVVVVGGGLLGLEAARGLQQRGLAVEIVHQGTHLMEKQLDPAAGAVLRRTIEALGIGCYVESRAVAVLPGGPSGVRGVRLANRYELPCELVVFACGIRPSVGLARDAGLDVRSAIVVDDRLSTSDATISAIGECAEHDGIVHGYVAAAWEQADALAAVLAGDRTAAYRGSRQVTRLRAAGVDVAAMGDTLAEPDARTEVIRFTDPVRRTYKKVVVRDGRLAGVLLVGDLATVATVTRAFDRQSTLPADRLHLLFGTPASSGTPPQAEGRVA